MSSYAFSSINNSKVYTNEDIASLQFKEVCSSNDLMRHPSKSQK